MIPKKWEVKFIVAPLKILFSYMAFQEKFSSSAHAFGEIQLYFILI